MADKPCSLPECDRVGQLRQGYCNAHYTRFRKYGDPRRTKISPHNLTLQEKMFFHGWDEVDGPLDTPCWIWAAGRFPGTGYGAIYFQGQNRGAHRAALSLHLGVPMDELNVVCHHCDTPECVNPNHLFEGTHADNVQDMIRKGRAVHYYSERTACSRGHEYTEGSYWIRVKAGSTSRVCKECDRIRGGKHRDKRRGDGGVSI